MKSEQFDWKAGKVVLWDMSFLDLAKPLSEQLDDLKEDLAQIRYGDLLLDVGWYPEFSVDGKFIVKVISGTNWEAPIFQESHDTIEGFLSCLKSAILIASSTALSMSSRRR